LTVGEVFNPIKLKKHAEKKMKELQLKEESQSMHGYYDQFFS